MTVTAQLDRDITPKGDDYDLVRQTIERISLDYRAQPSLEDIASDLGVAPGKLQKTFSRWAGLTPKAFLQAVTLDHARRLLGDEGLPLLEASYELGLSGPGRLHDLFVTHEAMSPGDFKSGGTGLEIRYGYHPSPFGTAVIIVTERGLCGLAFADPGEEKAALEDMTKRWPGARFSPDQAMTAPYVSRIFSPEQWRADQPLSDRHDRHGFPGAGVGGALADPARGRLDLPGRGAGHRQSESLARGGSRGGAQPDLVRGAMPPGAGQIRRANHAITGASPASGRCSAGRVAVCRRALRRAAETENPPDDVRRISRCHGPAIALSVRL